MTVGLAGIFSLAINGARGCDNQFPQGFRPIIDDLIVSNSVSYLGVVPVPGIVYRIGQRIKFDLINLVTPAACAIQVQLTFHGVRRRPC